MLAVGLLTPDAAVLRWDLSGLPNTIDFLIPTTDPGFNAATGVWTIHAASQIPIIIDNAAINDTGQIRRGQQKRVPGVGHQSNAALIAGLSDDGDGVSPLLK